MRHRCLTLVLVFTLALGAFCSLGAQASGPPSGSVWAWGNDSDGQLGNGTFTTAFSFGISLPVQVVDPAGTSYLAGISAIAGGATNSLALKSDGTVWAWGDNYEGQLGNNTTTNSSVPVLVVDHSDPSFYLTHVSAITTGQYHCLALKSDGTVWVWGWNDYGQLGNNSTTNSSLPVQVVDPSDASGYLTHVTAIAAGYGDSLALKSDGTVRAWGDNSNGQLGNGTFTTSSPYGSSVPVQVLDPSAPSQPLTNVTAISAGYDHSLAIVSSPNRFDLNTDGYPDLLWQNQTTGEVYYWLMNEASRIGGRAIAGNADPNWKIVGTADLNGDGHPDLIWENQSSGAVYYWLMNGTTKIGGAAISGNADPHWQIVGTADLNGNGHPDLLFENQTTGAIYYWLMNRVTKIGSGAISGNTNPSWKIVGVADLNADGSPDLLWENQTTGAISYWLMNGVTKIGSGTISGNADPHWRVVGP